MPDARISIGINGDSDVARTLAAVEAQQGRIIAAGRNTLEQARQMANGDAAAGDIGRAVGGPPPTAGRGGPAQAPPAYAAPQYVRPTLAPFGAGTQLLDPARPQIQAGDLQSTLALTRDQLGELDPVRNRADLMRLREHQREQLTSNKRLNQEAPGERLAFADRRAAIEDHYENRQNYALGKAADMEAKYQARGGQGTPLSVEKWLASESADMDQEREKQLSEIDRLEQEHEQNLTAANEGLQTFTAHIEEIGAMAGRYQRGELSDDEARPSTKTTGMLEELRLLESQLKIKLDKAQTPGEQADVRGQLQDTQKKIDQATGGTDAGAGARLVADKVNSGLRTALMAGAGAMGGTIGAVAQGAVTVASQAKEMFTLDLPKILGAAAATAGVAAATAVGLLVPKGKELEAAQNRLAGINGIKANDFDFGNRRDFKLGGEYGLTVQESLGTTLSEFRDLAREVALSSGSTKDLEGRTTSNLIYSRALGVDMGQLNGLGGESYRLQNGGSMDRNIAQMLSIFQRSGIINMTDKGAFDTSRLAESFSRVQSLTDAQKSRFGEASLAKSAGLVAAGEKLGGMFRGSTGNQMLMGIDSSIRNPGNDFVQAFQYRALARPGDSIYQLEKRKQQGIFDGGENYAREFDLLSRKHGGRRDELFMMDLGALTNLGDNYNAVERLAKGGRNALKGVSSEKDFLARYGSDSLMTKAVDQTGDLSKIETMVVNKMQIMGVGAKDALVGVAETMGINVKAPKQLTQAEFEHAGEVAAIKKMGDMGEKQLEQQRQINRNLIELKKVGGLRPLSEFQRYNNNWYQKNGMSNPLR